MEKPKRTKKAQKELETAKEIDARFPETSIEENGREKIAIIAQTHNVDLESDLEFIWRTRTNPILSIQGAHPHLDEDYLVIDNTVANKINDAETWAFVKAVNKNARTKKYITREQLSEYKIGKTLSV